MSTVEKDVESSDTAGDRPRSAAARLLRPRSVLVTGISQRPGTLGRRLLGSLVGSGFGGSVHALGRKPATVSGLECATDFDQLPYGIDLALLGVPAAGIADTVRECVAHGVGAAVCYASGFAERGDEGRRQEAELDRLARAGGLALLGPNCFGFLNTVDEFSAMLAPIPPVPAGGPEVGPAVAVIAQSGSIGTSAALSLGSRGVPISYIVTTGNEIGLGTPELIEFFAADEHTGAVAIYAEQIREPERFTAAVQAAAAAGKPVVLMHPGRSARAQAAAASHTGALTGDHMIMTTMSNRAGAAVVDTFEELIDLSQLLLRFPQPPTRGPSVITASGAICAIATDAAELLDLELPELTPGIGRELDEALAFTDVANPLDVSTQPISQPEIMRMAAQRMADDPAVGSILVSMPSGTDEHMVPFLDHVLTGAAGSGKPLIWTMQSEDPPSPEFHRKTLENRVVFHHSPERALRTLARATEFGRSRAIGRAEPGEPLALPQLVPGPQPEWVGKQVLAAAGIAIPDGALATTADEAAEIAARIGYPVVAKAQAAQLAHKTDIGGVILNIPDQTGLRRAWQQLHDAVAAARPDLVLDGILIERMSPPGVEMVIGARRDPHWGAVLLLGSGGVLVELLHDVRLVPADLPHDAMAAEISRLKGARLLHGFRGTGPADLDAVAAAAVAVGRLMAAEPRITEIDVNPLVAHPTGTGAIALDALVVTAP